MHHVAHNISCVFLTSRYFGQGLQAFMEPYARAKQKKRVRLEFESLVRPGPAGAGPR